MPRIKSTILLAVAVCATPNLLSAQSPAVPTRPIGTTSVEFREPLYALDHVRVLSSGNLILNAALGADYDERRNVVTPHLYFLSFASGAARVVGTQGRGPDEYMNAGPLHAAAADTTWMVDEWRPRLVVITPDGRVARIVPMPAAIIPEEGVGNYSLRFVQTDTVGNFFDLRWSHENARTTTLDSTALRRRGNGQGAGADTIAWLYTLTRRTPSRSLPGFTALPYGWADAWRVSPSGDVVIVRGGEYRVDRIPPNGALSPGPPIPYERRPVTQHERRAYIADLSRNARSARAANLPFEDPTLELERAEWPVEKPPFTGDVVISANQRVWIPMTPSANGDPIVYDVVAFDGVLKERVAMPPNTTVVGFGPGAVYTLRRAGARLFLARWDR